MHETTFVSPWYMPRGVTVVVRTIPFQNHGYTTYIDSHKLHDIIDGRDDDGRTALMYAVM